MNVIKALKCPIEDPLDVLLKRILPPRRVNTPESDISLLVHSKDNSDSNDPSSVTVMTACAVIASLTHVKPLEAPGMEPRCARAAQKASELAQKMESCSRQSPLMDHRSLSQSQIKAPHQPQARPTSTRASVFSQRSKTPSTALPNVVGTKASAARTAFG